MTQSSDPASQNPASGDPVEEATPAHRLGSVFGDGPAPIVCGHRGAPALAPENTLPSFAAAIERGATWFEFDVRPTADGALIIHHDPDTADGLHLASASAHQLDPSIPTFGALAEAFPTAGFDIEMKTDGIGMSLEAYAELVVYEIDTHIADQPIVVTSFDADALAQVRYRRPDVATGLLFWRGTDEDAVARAVDDGHLAIAPFVERLDASTMQKAREASLAVMTWTVNDGTEAARVAALGVDMIIGDDPAVIAAAL